MRPTAYILASGMIATLSIGTTFAAAISNGGALTPATNILTGDSTPGNLGTRPVSWTSSQSPARGQSFTFSGSGDFTVQAIWVRVSINEDFSVWTSNSLTMKLLGDPVTRSATSLGDFDYDATGLGTVSEDDWLRFELGSGMTMTAGTEYSFLLSPGELNSVHTFNMFRQKTGGIYTGGRELNANNDYDRANWDTDPWNDDALVANEKVATSASNLFFYVEGVAVPEPGAALLGGLGFLALLRRRRH